MRWNDRLLRALSARAAGASLSTLRVHQADFLEAQLERDAIFDASSLPDPSNLQSENVQEEWNWIANWYQKR